MVDSALLILPLTCLSHALVLAALSYFVFRSWPTRGRATMLGCSQGVDMCVFGYPMLEYFFADAGLHVAVLNNIFNVFFVYGLAFVAFNTAMFGRAAGERRHADGGVYDGDWLDGKKEGKGAYVYKSGAVYEGEWQNNVKHGSGMYKFAKGAVYVGEFLGGRPHGLGLKTMPSGKQYAGTWHEGKLQEERPLWQLEQPAALGESAAEAARGVAKQAGAPIVSQIINKAALFPPLLAAVLGIAVLATGAPIPEGLEQVMESLARANRPLLMTGLGMVIPLHLQRNQIRQLVTML
ncbi:hypothetical protein CYMTET_32737, partial [Cymbomonas tetramitiformis]